MKKQVSFKKGENMVTIEFNTNDYFSLLAHLSKVTVTERDEVAEKVREDIEENLEWYLEELQDKSINELIDSEVNDIMDADGIMSEYDNTPYATNYDTDLIKVEYYVGGQCYDDLLELLPNSEPIKKLVSLWKKYQLSYVVDQSVIDQVVELLDQLDSGKSENDLAKTIVNDYIKENY